MSQAGTLIVPSGREIFADDFSGGLSGWQHEGIGQLEIVSRDDGSHAMRLDCTESRQGGAGCHAFCRHDIEDDVAIEYDLLVHESNGLVITFVAMVGLHGEDMFTDLPPRQGVFNDYVGDDSTMKSYHVSVSRYNDAGVHSGVSNWRKNPGLNMVGQGPDLCETIGRNYAISIIKNGPHCQLGVDGVLAHEFTDPDTNPSILPTAGKLGFRAIGSKVIADIADFRVTALR
jgi:hypothetical protein